MKKINKEFKKFTLKSTVSEVINNENFKDFGRLFFPIDRRINLNDTLEEVTSENVFIWYSHLNPLKTVEILNNAQERIIKGETIFYSIYRKEEQEKDSSLKNTGLFYFSGKPNEKYAIICAGGGFMYVGALHDSFPHALEISKKGYNSFVLIYRPDDPYNDLARAIIFITENSDKLKVNKLNYSLWGGSAGARMAATLGNKEILNKITKRNDIPFASSVIMQYTGYDYTSPYDAPTFVIVGKNDYIANWRGMQNRLLKLKKLGINTLFRACDGLSHGFGIGTNTVADGWINDAIDFWIKQCK